MAVNTGFHLSPEANRAHLTHTELPHCDGLRMAALAMALTQSLRTTRLSEAVDLGLIVQAFFVMTGFLLVKFLMQDRVESPRPGFAASRTSARLFLRSLPTSYVFAVIAFVLYLPRILSMERVEIPDLAELPASIDRWLRLGLADFLRGSADGRLLIAWPLIVLFVPRQLLGIGFLALLGSGLMVQFSGLLSGELRPVSILVKPSPLDLLAVGALIAAICQGFGKSGDGPLARWALLMGLALATASVGLRSQTAFPTWGTLTLLSAPPEFGALNFILKIMVTTLVATLVWRDIGR